MRDLTLLQAVNVWNKNKMHQGVGMTRLTTKLTV